MPQTAATRRRAATGDGKEPTAIITYLALFHLSPLAYLASQTALRAEQRTIRMYTPQTAPTIN